MNLIKYFGQVSIADSQVEDDSIMLNKIGNVFQKINMRGCQPARLDCFGSHSKRRNTSYSDKHRWDVKVLVQSLKKGNTIRNIKIRFRVLFDVGTSAVYQFSFYVP